MHISVATPCNCMFLLFQTGNIEFWARPILPAGSHAFAVLNFGVATPKKVTLRLSHIGLSHAAGYNVTEVFDGTYVGTFKPDSVFSFRVNPSGVFFGKAMALWQERNVCCILRIWPGLRFYRLPSCLFFCQLFEIPINDVPFSCFQTRTQWHFLRSLFSLLLCYYCFI